MAVAPQLLKAAPDVSKINGFSALVVTITKHLVPRGGSGQSVVSTQSMTREQLWDWQGAKLLTSNGPGWYHFNVVDAGGTGEDEWRVQIGSDAAVQQQEGSLMPGPFPSSPGAMMAGPNVPHAPLDPGVVQIMPGYFHNEALGLLTTPWRTTVKWRQGDDWPQPPVNSTTSTAPGGATWAYPGWNGAPGQQQQTPWGWPMPATDDPKLEAIKAELAESRRQAEADRRRADDEKRDREAREAREETRRLIEDNQKQMLMLVEKLTAKPTGPTESELALRREVEEAKRRAEEDKREAQRREDLRLADERHREEMRALREASANKPDPMLGLLTQFISTAQIASGENVRMIREASAQATSAAERGAAQVLELARSQRDGAVEGANMAVAMMKDNMVVQKDFYTQMLEMKGSDNTPWWGPVVMEMAGKIGSVGEALAQQRAQAAQQPVQPQYIPPQQQRAAAPAQSVPGIPTPTAIPRVARPGFIDTGGRPTEAVHDTASDEWVLPGGHRVKNSEVQLEGWKVALANLARRVAVQPTPTPAAAPEGIEVETPVGLNGAGTNGTNGTSGAAHEPAPAPSRGRGKAKRGGKRGGARQPAAAAAAAAPLPPPSADPKGYNLEELSKMSPADVFEGVRLFADPEFFGDIWANVQQLRAAGHGAVPVQKLVEYVMQGHAAMRQRGKSPPAMEMIESGHFDVLLARMMPDAPVEYRQAVAAGLRGVDEGGEEPGDDGEDEEEEGEEDEVQQ